jgi:hypothetical protein
MLALGFEILVSAGGVTGGVAIVVVVAVGILIVVVGVDDEFVGVVGVVVVVVGVELLEGFLDLRDAEMLDDRLVEVDVHLI